VKKIVKAILKRNYRVINVENDVTTDLLVLWRENNKVKFGSLSKKYFQRYGPIVHATCSIPKNRFWFRNNHIAESFPDSVMKLMELYGTGNFDDEIGRRLCIEDFISIQY